MKILCIIVEQCKHYHTISINQYWVVGLHWIHSMAWLGSLSTPSSQQSISQCFSIALITIRVHFCYIAVEYLQIRFRALLYFLVYAHLLGRYSLSKILLKASSELYVIRPRKSRELGITQDLIWESQGFVYLNAMLAVYYTFFYIWVMYWKLHISLCLMDQWDLKPACCNSPDSSRIRLG